MTKEEIQAQIDIIEGFALTNYFTNTISLLEELKLKLEEAKSINELLEHAFNSGINHGQELAAGHSLTYENFNNYINSINK